MLLKCFVTKKNRFGEQEAVPTHQLTFVFLFLATKKFQMSLRAQYRCSLQGTRWIHTNDSTLEVAEATDSEDSEEDNNSSLQNSMLENFKLCLKKVSCT